MEILSDLGFAAVVLTSAGIAAIFALGLQLQVGHAGLINFGQVGYFALGQYTVAVANERGYGVFSSIGLALLVALVASLLIGLVTLRLREDFLAITSIAASSLIYLFILNSTDITGGPQGIDAGTGFRVAVTRPFLKWLRENGWDVDRALPLLIIIWTIVIASLVFLMLLVRSPWGRMLRAVREDENAVRALGRNPFTYRLQALVIGALLGAVAGVLNGYNLVYITPESILPLVTFLAFVVVIVGGIGSFTGTVIAAVLLQWLIEGTRDLDLGLSEPRQAAVRFVVVGAGMMLLIAVRPQGLFGNKREMHLE